MLYTKKTIYKKQGKQWIIDSVIDSNVVSVLLNDDLVAKYCFKVKDIKISYNYGKITVNYFNGTKAIYE